MKKIIAMMMALMIIATMVGCGQTEPPKPLETPKVTATNPSTPAATPTPINTADMDEWEAQLTTGELKDLTILQEEQLCRVVYMTPNAETTADYKLIGYLPDDAKIVGTLKSLCDQYMIVAANFDYTSVTGREEWSLYTDRLRNMVMDQQIDAKQVAYIKDHKIVSEYTGTIDYVDMLLSADGNTAIVSFKGSLKIDGSPEHLKVMQADQDGNAIDYCTLRFVKINGQWLIDLYINKAIDRVDIESVM